MSRLSVAMHCLGIAVRRHWLGVPIRLDFHRRAAIPEVPVLPARLGAEGTHFECDRITRLDSEGRRVGRVDGGREFIGVCLVNDLHNSEVVINPAFVIDDLEHFAVAPWAIINALEPGAFGGAAIAESPLEGANLSRSAPGTRAVQSDFLSSPNQMMRPSDREQFRT